MVGQLNGTSLDWKCTAFLTYFHTMDLSWCHAQDSRVDVVDALHLARGPQQSYITHPSIGPRLFSPTSPGLPRRLFNSYKTPGTDFRES